MPADTELHVGDIVKVLGRDDRPRVITSLHPLRAAIQLTADKLYPGDGIGEDSVQIIGTLPPAEIAEMIGNFAAQYCSANPDFIKDDYVRVTLEGLLNQSTRETVRRPTF